MSFPHNTLIGYVQCIAIIQIHNIQHHFLQIYDIFKAPEHSYSSPLMSNIKKRESQQQDFFTSLQIHAQQHKETCS